jgi:hypothetical protein
MKTLARPADRAEIRDRLRTLKPDSKARWGRMSAHQMVCHLSDACRMALGEKTVMPASNLIQRTMIKWIALYLPMPWPRSLPTRPELDQDTAGTRPVDFATDLARLAGLLDLSAAARSDRPRHPVMGRMSESEWLRWGYLHADHHLRQFGA